MKKDRLLVVDLDKTLLSVNSIRLFLLYTINLKIIISIIYRLLGIYDKNKFAEILTLHAESNIRKIDVFVGKLKKYIRNDIISLINEYKGKSGKVVIISASPEIYVKKIAQSLGFQGIGSNFDDKRRFIHMHGEQKKQKVCSLFPTEQFVYWFAISDHISDSPLLDMFEHSFMVKQGRIIKYE